MQFSFFLVPVENLGINVPDSERGRGNLIGSIKVGMMYYLNSKHIRKFGLGVILWKVRGDRNLLKFTNGHFHPYSLCWEKIRCFNL